MTSGKSLNLSLQTEDVSRSQGPGDLGIGGPVGVQRPGVGGEQVGTEPMTFLGGDGWRLLHLGVPGSLPLICTADMGVPCRPILQMSEPRPRDVKSLVQVPVADQGHRGDSSPDATAHATDQGAALDPRFQGCSDQSSSPALFVGMWVLPQSAWAWRGIEGSGHLSREG